MTDTAGYSALVFGLFWLLGDPFSPRLAYLGESRFWRMDRTADHGALHGLARQRIKPPLISQNWDDMLRVAGSLKMGTVRASEFICEPSVSLRKLGEGGTKTKTKKCYLRICGLGARR
jgi:TnpA family transposase